MPQSAIIRIGLALNFLVPIKTTRKMIMLVMN